MSLVTVTNHGPLATSLTYLPRRARARRKRTRVFLHEACGDDEALRREVESLLAQEQSAEGFLSVPAVDVAAKLIHDD
jgi:hypothetical protein